MPPLPAHPPTHTLLLRAGQDGVYYGSRFGKDIPWATGWPYNSLRDPQYLGSLLSLAAMAPIVPAEILTWWACK
jgi:phosphatidyl-N-methylethanolamine N-methyltransferase